MPGVELAQRTPVSQPEQRRDVAGVRCADFELSSADLDTSLDLVAIARARGGTSS